MRMKYRNATLGQVEAVWNKLGGEEGVAAFLRGDVTITVNKHTVDLGAPPQLPFSNAKIEKHDGEGLVEIELRSDDNLYVDGKLVSLFLSERQKGDSVIAGHELRQELENGDQVLLNSNVLDYLYDHPELFPEHWKVDEDGKIRYIYFWGSVFRSPSNGCLCVRYLCWGGGGLYRLYDWLGNDWNRQNPSASLAS